MCTSSSSSNKKEKSDYFYLKGYIKGTKNKGQMMKINFSINENEIPQNLP